MTLYEEATAQGIETGSHESDLYLKDSPQTRILIMKHMKKSGSSIFRSNVDGLIWWDCPFAYDPFWEDVQKKVERRTA